VQQEPEDDNRRRRAGAALPSKAASLDPPKEQQWVLPSDCKVDDLFCYAAQNIATLSMRDPDTARDRWLALKESAKTDTDGSLPPEIYDAAQIAAHINHWVLTLIKHRIVLSIRDSHDYLKTLPGLDGALPTRASYERTFLGNFYAVHQRAPHNYGSTARPRYAVTYAELLHMHGIPGLNLVSRLKPALTQKLEAL
jgi:hypothetical protein